jgi:inward rectifier potassium channel
MSITASPTPPRLEDKNDLGFGSVVSAQSQQRLLNKDGSFNVKRRGLGLFRSQSLYHSALSMTWPKFLWTVALVYIGINFVFAGLFLLCGQDALVGATEAQMGGSFGRAFFFSVETFATIGYGEISPVGIPGHMVMVLEALIAVMSQALITGLLFARFSKPTAAILFSQNMIVAPYQGGRALMFRITNLRDSQLLDVHARVNSSWMDGGSRTFRLLELERAQVMFFPLSWTVVHPITSDSPVYGVDEAEMAARDFEFLVTVSATDETFAQQVHTRSSYKANEVLWGAKFRNIFNPPDDKGQLSVDVERIDDVERVSLPQS